MNNRIKQLWEEAAIDIKDEYGNWIGRKLDEEKFAELIVRECLDIVDDEGCGEGGSVRAIKSIKEHFGVEE